MRKVLLLALCLLCLTPVMAKRKQWTEKQAWEWDVKKSGDIDAQLKNFGDFQVHWFAKGKMPAEAHNFKFNQISTQKQP